MHVDNFIDYKNLQYVFMQVADDTFSRLSIGSTVNMEKKKNDLEKEVHRLARLEVCLLDVGDGGVVVKNGSETSLVAKVKEKLCNDPIPSQIIDALR